MGWQKGVVCSLNRRTCGRLAALVSLCTVAEAHKTTPKHPKTTHTQPNPTANQHLVCLLLMAPRRDKINRRRRCRRQESQGANVWQKWLKGKLSNEQMVDVDPGRSPRWYLTNIEHQQSGVPFAPSEGKKSRGSGSVPQSFSMSSRMSE